MATPKCSLSFWRKLLSSGNCDNVSHKRFISLASFFVLIVLALLSAFGFNAMAEFVYIFLILCAGESALTTLDSKTERISRSKKKVKCSEEKADEEFLED